MSAQSLCPADFYGVHDLALLRRQGMRLSIGLAELAENIRDLQARPPFPGRPRKGRLVGMQALSEDRALGRAQ